MYNHPERNYIQDFKNKLIHVKLIIRLTLLTTTIIAIAFKIY